MTDVSVNHPYRGLPDHAFWKRSVSGLAPEDVDPVIDAPFKIGRTDAIATAGSCFAQHIARTLQRRGYHYLVTETEGEQAGVFPARFANIYTVRQLLQTFDRAYGLFVPRDSGWRRSDGMWVDPFRPQIRAAGWVSHKKMVADRKRHLACVRRMFEDCDIFVFTLGLTEGWVSTRDGAVFPVAPGVSGGEPGPHYAFHNFSVAEMVADLRTFLRKLRVVNPGVRVVVTVSPVPLVATYENRHVLVSNTYSKAALRVVAEEVSRSEEAVAYFPSYEIITGAQARMRFFAPDLREVTEEGVAHVMDIFARHFLGEGGPAPARKAEAVVLSAADRQRMSELAGIVCEEEALDA